MEKIILHSDLNNFFASAECVLNPELKDKPVAVSGNAEKRHGIVLAKNQIAKLAGVSTGETIYDAQRKCPNIIFVPPHYSLYDKLSKQVKMIYYRYSNKIEAFGLDECWLDVTDSQAIYGDGKDIAEQIRRTVKDETGLTVSIGVSFTKTFAKLASDMKKPDAVTVISKEAFKDIIWKLPAIDLLYIGKKTAQKLAKLNIKTIGDIARADDNLLKSHLGINGIKLKNSALGIGDTDVMEFRNRPIPKSVGHGTTTYKNITDNSIAKTVIFSLSELIATRLRRYQLFANGVHIHLKDCNLMCQSKQIQLDYSTQSAEIISKTAFDLLLSTYDLKKQAPLRAITISTYNLSQDPQNVQLDLFKSQQQNDKKEQLEKTLDVIRNKFGFNSITRASFLGNSYVVDAFAENDEMLPFYRG